MLDFITPAIGISILLSASREDQLIGWRFGASPKKLLPTNNQINNVPLTAIDLRFAVAL